jgi:hypothetical protein
VELTSLGALTFFFDPEDAANSAIPLATAVAPAASLEEAHDALAALGVRTELELEREGADVTRAQVGGRIEREAHEARSNGRPAALGQHDAVGTRCGRPSAHRREAASSPILEFSTCPWFRYNLLQ